MCGHDHCQVSMGDTVVLMNPPPIPFADPYGSSTELQQTNSIDPADCQEHIDEGKGPVYVLSGAGFECCYPGTKASKVPAGAIKMAYWIGPFPVRPSVRDRPAMQPRTPALPVPCLLNLL